MNSYLRLNHRQSVHHKDESILEELDYQLEELNNHVLRDILNEMRSPGKVPEIEGYANEENHRDNHKLDHREIFHRYVMEQWFDVLMMPPTTEYWL